MANKGKFFDRMPDTRAAGIVIEPDGNIGDNLKLYPLVEQAENIMKRKCREQMQQKRRDGNLGYRQNLPTDSVPELMSPELKKSRFLVFREKFMEGMFLPKVELGKAFNVGSKPEHFTNSSTTYGNKIERSEDCYELIFPNKSPEQVNREYIEWHNKKIISHNRYLPSEQINRKYTEPFNSKDTFGVPTRVDKSGILVKKCLTHCDRAVVISGVQKLFFDRTKPILGTSLNRYQLKLDPDLTFGIKTGFDGCDVHALIENIDPCTKVDNINKISTNIEKFRHYLYNRVNFHMFDLKAVLHQFNVDENGCVSFDDIKEAMNLLRLCYNENHLKEAIIYFKLVEGTKLTTQRINIDQFLQLIHLHHPLPHPSNTITPPSNFDNKHTTYRLLCDDLKKPLPPERKKKELILGDDERTRAGDCISPDIPTHYGLLPSDLEKPRPKDQLKIIFKRLLIDNFDGVWELACQNLNKSDDCLISVNDLRKAMNEYKIKVHTQVS